MRLTIVCSVLALALCAIPASNALAGATDQARVGKIVRKYAQEGNVFDDKFKPKAICFCHDLRLRNKAGILQTSDGLNLFCAIPTTVVDGEFEVVDFGCQDFDVLGK